MKNKKFYKKKSKVDKNLLFPSKPCYDAFLKHSKIECFFYFLKNFSFFLENTSFHDIYGILINETKKEVNKWKLKKIN